MRCQTCQNEATIHVALIGCHFCASCLKKIDERIAEINEGAAMRLKIMELDAARSEALQLLESLLPITWSEDWDADEVRRKLEWAIRFCGGTPNVSDPRRTPEPALDKLP